MRKELRSGPMAPIEIRVVGDRFRTLAGNLVVLGVATTTIWLVLELVVLPIWVHRLPLRLHGWIVNGAVRTLAQSSKARARPVDYVALLGDSYAAGEGDWRLTVDAGTNPPHHSAHLIHATTGRDVVSFGHAGSGSLRGIVTEPITQVDYLRDTWRFGIEDPTEILVYFYAGNDLDDNLEDLRLRYDAGYEPDRPRGRRPAAASFDRFLDEVVIGEGWLSQKREHFHAVHNFYVVRSMQWVFEEWRESARLPRTEPRPLEPQFAAPRARGPHSVVEVGGQRLETPIPLQAPAPKLNEEETRTALWVFERALLRAAERFEDSRFRVLYIPAALLVYPMAPVPELVQEDHALSGRPWLFEPPFLEARSDSLCANVAEISGRLGIDFRDARPALRAAGAARFLHGPRDWKHLNREGYEVLAAEAAALLEEDARGGTCARISAAPIP